MENWKLSIFLNCIFSIHIEMCINHSIWLNSDKLVTKLNCLLSIFNIRDSIIEI